METIAAGLYLAVNAVTDLRERRVYLIYSGIILILGGGFLWNKEVGGWVSSLLGVAFGIFFIFLAVVTREAIGTGDGIVIALTGLLTGFEIVVPATLLGMLGCAFTGIILIVFRADTRKLKLPLVPYLFAGFLMTCFFRG